MARIVALLALLAAIAAADASAALIQFTTPSRNIGCIGDKTRLRCDIVRTSVKPPPKPLTCDFDWGNAFELLPRFAGHRLCVSDSALGAGACSATGRASGSGRSSACRAVSGSPARAGRGTGSSLSRNRIKLF